MSSALERADDTVREAWERICVEPEKWQCSPWGDEGGGFWVVAVMSGSVVWYNDIEEGFNQSPFTIRGTIGEYRCDQTAFSGILDSLPEAMAAEGFAERASAATVPPELTGPGHVARRQTTFWELKTDDGSLARVHFSHQQETRFARAEYDRVALVREHPLLEGYRQRWGSVFVTDAKRCRAQFTREVAARVNRATDGWRTAEEYLALGGFGALRAGHGLVMRAPDPIAAIAADVLQEFGAVPSVVLDDVPNQWRGSSPVSALLLGRNFVIAEAFRFVRLA